MTKRTFLIYLLLCSIFTGQAKAGWCGDILTAIFVPKKVQRIWEINKELADLKKVIADKPKSKAEQIRESWDNRFAPAIHHKKIKPEEVQIFTGPIRQDPNYLKLEKQMVNDYYSFLKKTDGLVEFETPFPNAVNEFIEYTRKHQELIDSAVVYSVYSPVHGGFLPWSNPGAVIDVRYKRLPSDAETQARHKQAEDRIQALKAEALALHPPK